MIYSLGTGKMVRMDVPANDVRNNLAVGTVLQLNGYSNPKFVILKNEGISESFSYYGARYRCVSLETGEYCCKDAYGLVNIEAKKDDRIQMYYTSQVLDADGIMDAIKVAEGKKAERVRAAQAEEQRKAAELDSFATKYPDLERVGARKITTYALGAANLRKELKKAFPSVKFSITSEGFSMGCAIRVKYQDGPTTAEVDAIADKYEYGTFDGMTDCAGYKDEQFTGIFGGARFVTVNKRDY